jgi:alpha-tubulin suppressor-like RCC1 family protein
VGGCSDESESLDVGLRSAAIDSLTVRAVAAGHDHAALLSSQGCLYVWGENSANQLGFDSHGLAEVQPGYLPSSIHSLSTQVDTARCCSALASASRRVSPLPLAAVSAAHEPVPSRVDDYRCLQDVQR